ncbi:GntR family transcriptional regulator [Bacillus mesophilus]|uniref:GntR family transcriptional regulator n=1 Tax=Bacillus mesophilus TaxID=1808955 RepID=A0A6M0Q5F7_9BACI|nr:GntR family transcriptional regulator [Bacillus mesophilus]MBM7660306.1 GntR family transcriptional regulator [Bacillus mesophilus]NEY71019.1 GntR family transcriptional regulator [Bacillus mesophilus]
MTEEFQSSKPIYLQIVEKVIIDIVRGKQPLGEKLPSVREMAVQMGVNPNTIQRTYSELERMNIVETRRGQGTFVVNREELINELSYSLQDEIIRSFVQKMKEIGVPKTQILNRLQRYLQEGTHDDSVN